MMQEAERMISLYHSGYLICLALTLLALGIAIFMFFKFKIPYIFIARSGRGMRRTVREMRETNKGYSPLVRSGELRLTGQLSKGEEKELLLTTLPKKEEETGLLFNNNSEAETELLVNNNFDKETELLINNDFEAETELLKEEMKIQFCIKKSIVITNAEDL